MDKTLRNSAVVLFLPLALAACGGGGGGDGGTTVVPPPAQTATFQSRFGTSFASYFDTSSTTPDASVKDPAAADVPALSLTTEPLDN